MKISPRAIIATLGMAFLLGVLGMLTHFLLER